MPGNEFEEREPGDGILERMGHHAGPQALPQMSEYAKENSINPDHNHHSPALICVRKSKNNSRGHDAHDGIAAKRAKLALQISAEDNFFKQAGAYAQEHKESGFKIGMGGHWAQEFHCIVDRFLHVVEIDGAQSNANPEKKEY